MWYFTTTYFCWSDFNFSLGVDVKRGAGPMSRNTAPVHRAHHAASRRALRVTGCFATSSLFPFTYSTFPAYFPAYSVKTKAPSSGCFNYISARCARCGISWHPGLGARSWVRIGLGVRLGSVFSLSRTAIVLPYEWPAVDLRAHMNNILPFMFVFNFHFFLLPTLLHQSLLSTFPSLSKPEQKKLDQLPR